jgi:alkylhydroperoxidase/carboxymuconolactone decarboxylase family protein YurZ
MQDGTGELIVDNQYTNIEHVLPQKPAKWGYSEEEVNPFVNQIGNLVIVSKKINSSIGNAPLEEKLPDLMKSELAIVEDFLTDSRTGKWDEAAINKRSRKLATIAYDKIWVF